MRGGFLVLSLVAAVGPSAACTTGPFGGRGRDPAAVGDHALAGASRPFLKGQLHVHSSESTDGDTSPADVAAWYAARGYDFIVFSDHDDITQPDDVGGLLVLPGIELTVSVGNCEPPPLPGMMCMIHVNGLFVETAERGPHDWSAGQDRRRLSLYERAVDEAMTLGAMPMLNHPNFHFSADERLAATLGAEGVPLLEISNQKTWASNLGDRDHPSTEAFWDAVLSTGVDMWGVATDDAHHVGDDPRGVGDRGWVQVRAARDVASIRDALERGDFYSSTGVELSRLEVAGGWLEVEAAPSTWRPRFDFIGAGGAVLDSVVGFSARFPLADAEDYVRVVVTADDGGQAWTQPIR